MRTGYINLDLEAQRIGTCGGKRNPLLDPATCHRFVLDLHGSLGIDCSYGGWLEDRRNLWAGSYLEKGSNWLHLGVDFNAPADTAIYAEHDMRVVWTGDDHPEEHGWGRRVIFELNSGLLLAYAHIEPVGGMPAGARVSDGALLGFIDRSDRNGGWHPHVHVQCYESMSLEAAVASDGYGDPGQRHLLARMHPDPMQYVSVFERSGA